MAKHERAAAFGGNDGQPYSVAIYVDDKPDLRGLYGAALLFVRWNQAGDRPVNEPRSADSGFPSGAGLATIGVDPRPERGAIKSA